MQEGLPDRGRTGGRAALRGLDQAARRAVDWLFLGQTEDFIFLTNFKNHRGAAIQRINNLFTLEGFRNHLF